MLISKSSTFDISPLASEANINKNARTHESQSCLPHNKDNHTWILKDASSITSIHDNLGTNPKTQT